MAALTFNARTAPVTTPTRVTLTASDTFTFVPNTNQVVEFHNTTAGPLTANLKGSAPQAAFPVQGAGHTVSLTAGYDVLVPANSVKVLQLDAVAGFLAGNGTVTMTGATAVFATLLSN